MEIPQYRVYIKIQQGVILLLAVFLLQYVQSSTGSHKEP